MQKGSPKLSSKKIRIRPKWREFSFPISTENLINDREYEGVLKDNQKVGLVLDVAHAYQISPMETNKIIKNYGKRITEIHLSSVVKGQDHQPFSDASEDFLDSISEIRDLNCPIMLETSTSFSGNKRNIEGEVALVIKWLKGTRS